MDYFKIRLSRDELLSVSSLGLAHLGDGVYELLVRSWLCVHGKLSSGELHRAAVSYVSAPAQSAAAQKLMPLLTEDEMSVFKRGRNANPRHAVPQNAAPGEYARATGLEALFGWLWLSGETDRINQLFAAVMDEYM